jgi:uncharacterized repeat protein (TIGR01451 family)
VKKIYFLLFLFSFVIGKAQTNLLNSVTCDLDNDGITYFDLNAKNAEMQFILSPGDYSFAYYHSLADAQSDINPIPTVSFYANVSSPEQLYSTATNVQTLEKHYFQFTLLVDQQMIFLNEATLTFCSDTELAIYNLYDANQQMIGDQQNLNFAYYEHETGNQIVDPSLFVPTVLPVQIIDVVITNTCGTIETMITLHTNDCTPPPCQSPTILSVDTATVSSTIARLMWVSQDTNFHVYLTVPGTPAPMAATTPTALVQSSSFPRSYVATGLIPATCYQFYVRTVCNQTNPTNFSQWIGPFNFCTRDCDNNGTCDDNLTLVAFFDANNNGVKDNGETNFDMGMFNYEINGSGNILHGYTNNGFFRIFDNNPTNLYDLSFAVNPELTPYYTSTVTFNDLNIPTGGGTHTYYFPVAQLQSYNDLEVELIPYAQPRPGFTYSIMIRYKNRGMNTIANGTVNFIKDTNVSIVNVSPNVVTNTPDGFSFNFTNLAVNEERMAQIVLQVPTIPTVNLGQMLTNSAEITPLVDDAFPTNNSNSLTQTIVGSYDPNDKTEAHGGKIAMDTFTENDFLTYTIQFENTGTASAEFIRVEDLLDASLNPESVAMLNASHPYNMRRMGNKLIWNFYNVNLPPTSTNPTQSHGFIQFKIKPTAGYTIGTMIPNAADIYFDYNPAIVTDTFQTEFVETLATTSFDANGFYMYPNPAKTFVNLGLKDSAESIANVNIYDVLGKSVRTISDIEATQMNFDVSTLTKGIYFVEITTKNQLKITKKLVIQ